MPSTPSRPPKILIASTSEGLDYARALKELLAPRVDAEIWDEEFFAPGDFTLEALGDNVPEYDGAVVLATADDHIVSRATASRAPRDNLILEFGLFVAVLGRRRALLAIEAGDDVKVPSDVAGLTCLKFSPGASPKASLQEVAQRLTKVALKWHDDPPIDKALSARIDGLLKLFIDDVREHSGIKVDFGLHVYLIDKRSDPPRLYRAARARLGPRSAKKATFVKGEGIVGACWSDEEEVFADFTEGPLRHAGKVEWEARGLADRYGMDWDLLSASRKRYKAVGAVAISDFSSEDGFVGCIAYNLGKNADQDPAVLERPAVKRVINALAEAMAIILR